MQKRKGEELFTKEIPPPFSPSSEIRKTEFYPFSQVLLFLLSFFNMPKTFEIVY